jgi:hypothetical protein
MRAEEMPPEPEPSAPSDTQDLTQHPTPDTQHPTPATPDDSEGDTKDETDAPPANPWQSNPWQGDL